MDIVASELSERDLARRDELISLARVGEVSPEDAEAEAAANGWAPFKRQPEPSDFDPMRDSRWPIIMAIAWIAWRDVMLVREISPAFRAECTWWVFKEWKQPKGAVFVRQEGWFLEPCPQLTAVRLAMRTSPSVAQLTIAESKVTLWLVLCVVVRVAEGLDANARPVDIPQREWSYLDLYEERERDVLKYGALDRFPAFTDVKLKRVDVLLSWPLSAGTLKVERECMAWLVVEMEKSPLVRPKAKAEYWAGAQARFKSLAKRQFERAWAMAVAQTGATAWSKAGRLPQKSNHRTK